jgi:hypothetical protein
MVPERTLEERTVMVTKCRPETRERMITVYNRVPETVTKTRTFTVMVPETKTRTVRDCITKPVWETVTQTYTVQVPYQETVQSTRRVAKCVTYTETVNVTKDMGHWETVAVDPCAVASTGCGDCGTVPCCDNPCPTRRVVFRRASRCGNCGTNVRMARCESCNGCGVAASDCCTRKVWVANLVTEPVEVTRQRIEYVDVPCTQVVTRCRTEERTREVKLCKLTTEYVDREVQYTTCRAETKTEEYQATVYKCVAEQKPQQYTVMVPYQEEQTVQVPVCHMVPKVVTCSVRCGGCCRG